MSPRRGESEADRAQILWMRAELGWLCRTIERVHAAGAELIPTRTSVRVAVPPGKCVAVVLGRELRRDVGRLRNQLRHYLAPVRCTKCRVVEVPERGTRCPACTWTWRTALGTPNRAADGQ